MGWSDFRPFEYLDDNNNVTGINIDIAKAVAKDLNCYIEFKRMPWKRLVKSVEYGTLDILASATQTLERQKWAYFSTAYTQEKMVLFVRKGESDQYPLQSLSDITKFEIRIGVLNGAFVGPEFKQLMNDDNFSQKIEQIKHSIQNVKKLLRHRIDGYIANQYTDQIFQIQQQVISDIEIHPFPIYSTELHFMLSKASLTTSFLKRFNMSLKQLRNDGRYQEIIDRHTWNKK